MGKQIIWQCKHFNELSATELYNVLLVRQEVFLIEQECLYGDLDNLDQKSFHLVAFNEAGTPPLAYARILAPCTSYPEASIGRILTVKTARKQGLGRELITQALHFIQSEFANTPVKISAQTYLEKFYQDFGFKTVSEPYLDAGIEHITMLLAV